MRFAGRCVLCAIELPVGSRAVYEPGSKTVRCIACPVADTETAVDAGVAGGSAHREFERRKAAREALVKGRVGNLLGGLLIALTDEPQSTRAWERGASGEQKLGKALEGLDSVRALHDRQVPKTRGNIDHIVIGPAGVFVVDAKHYRGLIQVRDIGGLFKVDERLFVGQRDCSQLADNMGWQVRAVQDVLDRTPVDCGGVTVAPVLCFIDGEWPLLGAPNRYKGVHLEGPRSLKRLVTRTYLVGQTVIDELTGLLAKALPAKETRT